MKITTQKELRKVFWAESGLREFYRCRLTQNQYPTDVRVTWCDFVEACRNNGAISEELAYRATL